MKKIIYIMLALLPCFAFGLTRTVSLDGTHQYTNIQTAINACSNGDSVLVYPGRYIENINFNHKSITIASLYARNPLQVYIDSTIVDGNLETCIQAIYGEEVTINGFTIVNNEQNLNLYINNCGGIYADNDSYMSIYNCVIRDCTAGSGGGIAVGPGVSLYLSNTMVFNNKADRSGGGLTFAGSQITFDPTHPCSIYNNISPKGMDILFYSLHDNPIQYNIVLDVGSLALTGTDNYFISNENCNVNVSIQQGYFAQTDQDLYISPEGNDNNNGLAISTPMKTIARAMQRIKSNPDNPHTIHLAEGVYSYNANSQILPIGIKSQVKVIGAGAEHTIIDAELKRGFFKSYYSENCEISGMTLKNLMSYINGPVELKHISGAKFSDLKFINSQGSQYSGIALGNSHDVVIENVYVGDITSQDDIASLFLFNNRNVYVNNLLVTNCVITYHEGNFLGPIIFDSDFTIRNSIFANNTGIDSYLFSYQTIDSDYADCNLDMSNVLFFNNTVSLCSWVFCPIYMQNRYQAMKINNCTMANNITNTSLTKIYAYADVKNMISYNPQASGELFLKNEVYNEDTNSWINAEVNVSNSLFRVNSVNSSLPNLVTQTDNIMGGNPLFQGRIDNSLDVSQPEYYHLSSGSPCINTGIADTTGMNLPIMDLAGNHRVWDGRIDMGCFEYGSHPVANDNPEYTPLPDRIQLSAYPNPVYLNGSKGAYTFIEFTLPEKSKTQPVIEIYNLKGQRVRSMTVGESFQSMQRKAGLKDNNYKLRITNDELKKQAGCCASARESSLPAQERQGGRLTNRLEACLTDKQDAYATFSTIWDCKDDVSHKLASGIYLVKVTSGKHYTTRKLTILK